MLARRYLLGATLFLTILILAACGSVMKMTGKLAGRLLTQKTADLSNSAVSVYFIRNMYPPETNTVETEYFDKNDWRPGANVVVVTLFKRKGIGMYSVDGKVTMNGEEMPYLGNGAYGKWLDKNDLTPKTVQITTSTGKVYTFTVSPPPPIEIISVNGKTDNIEVNLNQPLRLEMRSPNADENTEFSVALIHKVMGVRTFMENGIFKYRDQITIPAAMWRNSLNPIGPIKGANYLRVERFQVNPAIVPGVGAAQVVGTAIDCVPVTVTGELKTTLIGTLADQGIKVQKTIENEGRETKIDLYKPNAFWGRPLSKGKKFALVSFSVRATKLKQSATETKTSKTYTGNLTVTTTTITTTTRTFPTLPDAYWENLVNSLYADFEQRLRNVFEDIEFVPIEQVLAAPSYNDLHPVEDTVTVVEVEKSYKGTKNLIPTRLSERLKDISTTFASDRIDSRLIRELGVDGIIAVTVDLEMPWDEFTLTPRMRVRISGPPNGYKAGPTIYVDGTIQGEGQPLDQAKLNAQYLIDVLPNVIRQKELMNALEIGLNELRAKEQQADYEVLWKLK